MIPGRSRPGTGLAAHLPPTVDAVSEREPDARDEDEVWRSIVDNYGDRAELEPEDLSAPEPEPPADLFARDLIPEDADDPAEPEAFVPPEPPPAPLPRGPRLAAWAGVLLVPVLMLTAALTRLWLPTFVGVALVAWFVGGFGYLVATMPRGPRDPGDDGAVV
jgi:hypothetical protein